MPRSPVIGVTTSLTVDRTPERAYVNAAYLAAVQQAGGVPLLLPPHLDERARDALWNRLDGLLLTGGGDVDPARFGEPRHPAVAEVSDRRDALELELTTRAIDTGLPLFAICRGMQVLNIALGGTLYQDIASEIGLAIVHSQQAPRSEPTHRVKIDVERGRLGAILGVPELTVNSFHHQALKRLGRGLDVIARALDDVVEAVELSGARGLVIGVQWHPEDLVARDAAARRLFAALVDAAARR
jgi:putative glutamine amidotransferase